MYQRDNKGRLNEIVQRQIDVVSFRVKPKMDFKMAGTWPIVKLDKTKEYEAIHASNQPDWEEEGKIFVIGAENDGGDIGFLLSRGDYLLMPESATNWESMRELLAR